MRFDVEQNAFVVIVHNVMSFMEWIFISFTDIDILSVNNFELDLKAIYKHVLNLIHGNAKIRILHQKGATALRLKKRYQAKLGKVVDLKS